MHIISTTVSSIKPEEHLAPVADELLADLIGRGAISISAVVAREVDEALREGLVLSPPIVEQVLRGLLIGTDVSIGAPYSEDYDEGVIVSVHKNMVAVEWDRREVSAESPQDLRLGHAGTWPEERLVDPRLTYR